MGLRLLLVRHGATALSDAGRFCGASDPPLSAEGRRQADRLRRKLASDPVDSVVVSPLRRSRETAARAWPRLAPRADPDWAEMRFGDWEGLTADEIQARWPREWAAWMADPLGARVPSGESGAEVLARVRAGLARLAAGSPAGAVAVVTHGGPIGLLLCQAEGRDPSAFGARLVPPGEAVALALEGGEVSVASPAAATLRR
ncbi:MAG: histidine phosphatase family protein [Planctomycetales bacterium]|nr:histidine phosphatase family protein [Planctomycetales bacterium]